MIVHEQSPLVKLLTFSLPPRSKHCSVFSSCSRHTLVKVGDKPWLPFLQHVQKVIPLLLAPRLKPLSPQAQLALKDVWQFVLDLVRQGRT